MSDPRPAERRQVTVMFCDMVASTALSQRLDPEELADVIQRYRHRCADLTTRHGGIVARYVGDGVLALFGYPRAHEDDAERAIRAALAIAAGGAASSVQTDDLDVHIGIATGVVVVGNLPQGGEDISAIGGAPNLAARLEALAAPGTVVVSDETRQLTRGLFEYRDLGLHVLKGFDKPVAAWQVVGERKIRSRFHALRAAALTPLVDRQTERAELGRLWQMVRAGQGQAVLLSADPGVGKSRLAEAFARRDIDRNCLRLWYYSSPNLQSSPLAPLVRQLSIAAAFADDDDGAARLAKLRRLFPDGLRQPEETLALLADLLAIRRDGQDPSLGMSAQRKKRELFVALMRLLEAYAAVRPVVLVVEDLHWIDPSSDELIGILIDRVKTLPVMALFTARPEFHAHWDDKEHLHHMPIAPLARADSVTMIGLLCRDRPIPPATIEKIADRTDGLPLFIEDLTRDVLEGTAMQPGENVPAMRGHAPFSIPATLNDSLMSRLDRLGTAKAIAQVGAVIGREFSYELLASVADQSGERLREELHRLVEAGLLIGHRSTAILTYTFKHALVRDAAYSSLLRSAQVALHGRIARVLIDEFPETAEAHPEILAYHFQAANETSLAVDYLVKSAKLSAKRSGFVEAIGQLNNALQLLAAQPRTRARIRQELGIYRTLGGVNAEHRGFSSAECGRAYTTALELCRELGDAPEIFSVLSGLGSYEITRAGFAKCRELAQECLLRGEEQAAKPAIVMGHLLLGGTLFLMAELDSARKHLETALRLYDSDSTPRRGKQVLYVQDQKSTGLCYLSLTTTLMGDVDTGLAAAQRGLAHSKALGGAHTVNFSLCYLAAVLYIQGDFAGAEQRATQSMHLAREQGFATWIGISQTIRGGAQVANGDGVAGLAELMRGTTAHAGLEAVAYQPFSMGLLATGLIAAGRLDEAFEALTRGLAVSEATGERFYAAELWRLKGVVRDAQHSVAEAERCFREAIAIARHQQARLFELRSAISLCGVLEHIDRAVAVREILQPLLDGFSEGAAARDVLAARSLAAGATAAGR
jgi:class 3 adenylate cyclase/tetratricopeptide (TPR) repeat protein